jgi:hypothetical protein
MARQKFNPTTIIKQALEIGIGSALLSGLLVRYIFGYDQPDSFRFAMIMGAAFVIFWLVRPFVGWLLGMPHPPGVPRWWAKRNTGVLLAVVWGGAVFALAYYGWGWLTNSAIEIALYNGLGMFGLWLMKPFTIWLNDIISDGIKALFRLRVPHLPRIEWNRTGGARSGDAFNEEQELLQLTPREFEELCAAVARGWGYQARAVGESGDGGIDVQMWKDGEFVVGQCKRYVGTVPIGNVRDFYGAMLHVGAKRGYFFTTGRFSNGAYDFVKGKQIELLDGMAIMRSVSKHKVRLTH